MVNRWRDQQEEVDVDMRGSVASSLQRQKKGDWHSADVRSMVRSDTQNISEFVFQYMQNNRKQGQELTTWQREADGP